MTMKKATNPTPKQIQERAAEVRAAWSPGEEVRRRTLGPADKYRPGGRMVPVLVDRWGLGIVPVYVQEVCCG